MTFREYGVVRPKIAVAYTQDKLCSEIEKLGRNYEIIDLQYSTTTLIGGSVHYSALALVGKKKKKER